MSGQVQYPNDMTDISGIEHPTVGENIRNASSPENFSNSIKNNSDRKQIATKLQIRASALLGALAQIFAGYESQWCGEKTGTFNSSQLQNIKNYLGVVNAIQNTVTIKLSGERVLSVDSSDFNIIDKSNYIFLTKNNANIIQYYVLDCSYQTSLSMVFRNDTDGKVGIAMSVNTKIQIVPMTIKLLILSVNV